LVCNVEAPSRELHFCEGETKLQRAVAGYDGRDKHTVTMLELGRITLRW